MNKSKIIAIVILVVLVVAVALGVGLYALGREKQPGFDAVVLSVNEGSLSLYKAVQDENDRLCSISVSEDTKITGENREAIALSDIAPGMLVRVTHGDVVQEMYPPNYPQISEVAVLGTAEEALYNEGLEASNWMDGLIGDESVPGQPDSSDESVAEPGSDTTVKPPADSALYRGTVTGINMDGGTATLMLAQAEGTDYGMPEGQFIIDADTLHKFDLSAVAVGDYLEVWYGVPMGGGEVEQPIHVAAANKLLPAESVVYNGTLAELNDNGDGTGRMRLTPIGSGEEFIFNYDSATAFYLDFESLEVGDELNIFTSGVAALSLPPQAFALEVRPYAPPA